MNEQILQEISEFCRQRGLAESTFGRRAVNDGKLANRLRNGGRITTDTLDRIRAFMTSNPTAGGRGWMLPSSAETRPATTHFSLQVLTNSRYFCRLSKKRKLRCGSSERASGGAIMGSAGAAGAIAPIAIGGPAGAR